MSQMTYTRCGLCRGTLKFMAMIGIDERQVSCPCTLSSTPGWSPTGVTENQLERLAKSEETLHKLVRGERWESLILLNELRAAWQKEAAPIIPNAEMGSA